MKGRYLKIGLLAAGLFLACGLAVFSLFLRYTNELRFLTPWKKLHSANLVRGEKVAGSAWVYGNRRGDYLVLTKENPNFGPYLVRSGQKLVANCAWEPLGQPGANRIWTPVYVGGWTGCISMDGVKTPKTTATMSNASIDFYSEPYDWPPEETGKWRVEW